MTCLCVTFLTVFACVKSQYGETRALAVAGLCSLCTLPSPLPLLPPTQTFPPYPPTQSDLRREEQKEREAKAAPMVVDLEGGPIVTSTAAPPPPRTPTSSAALKPLLGPEQVALCASFNDMCVCVCVCVCVRVCVCVCVCCGVNATVQLVKIVDTATRMLLDDDDAAVRCTFLFFSLGVCVSLCVCLCV